jgi:hypothetical protein
MRYILVVLLALLAQHDLKKPGAAAMGFDQDKVVHHFRTTPAGGSIEVDVVDPADTDSLSRVRSHLREIARAFAAGDFGKPFQTHGEVPPGVPAMQRLKTAMTYTYADTPRGGAVRIRTSNAEALKAVHEFLKYQIEQHGTGDRVTMRD